MYDVSKIRIKVLFHNVYMIKNIVNQHLHNIEDKKTLILILKVSQQKSRYILQIHDHLKKCSDILKVHI